MIPAEPTLAALRNPLLRYSLATRPAFFFSVTVCVYLLGLAAAYGDGIARALAAAAFTIFFALLVHAGVSPRGVFNSGNHRPTDTASRSVGAC